MKTTLKSLVPGLLVALALHLPITHARAAQITVKGSDTMVTLGQKWAEVYMQKRPGAKIQVTGGGSGTGMAALQNQTTDLANSSRSIRPKEVAECIKAFKKRPTEYKVALDGLSVYVHESNLVTELSIEQLEQIFTGKIVNWKDVGGKDEAMTVYSRENSSGTYEFFKEHVLQGKDFTAKAQTLQGTAQVVQAVAKEPKGIGYGGAAYSAGVRQLKIKKDAGSPAIEPTEENIVSHTYPIWRFLYVYVNPNIDKGEIADYLKWIRSDEGQAVVKDIGYFPLPKNWRSQ